MMIPGSQPRSVLSESVKTGDRPRLSWRAVSPAHLALHPLYVPLPSESSPPTCTCGIHTVTTTMTRLMRQGTPAWLAARRGVITTSALSEILGFYEPDISQRLGVPKALRAHSRAAEAWRSLHEAAAGDAPPAEPPTAAADTTVSGSRACPLSCACYSDAAVAQQQQRQQRRDLVLQAGVQRASCAALEVALPSPAPNAVWESVACADHVPYPCRWVYRPSTSASDEEQPTASARMGVADARRAWGHEQEATAVVAAIDALGRRDDSEVDVRAVTRVEVAPLVAVLEVGLCLAEEGPWLQLQRQRRLQPLPPLGASPDGLILRSDGTVEVLEVKCVSPFVAAAAAGSRGSGALEVRDVGPAEAVGPWLVPQLQLEMLAVGAECTSATLVSLSATRGATLFHVARDDSYIEWMLRILAAFVDAYGGRWAEGGVPQQVESKQVDSKQVDSKQVDSKQVEDTPCILAGGAALAQRRGRKRTTRGSVVNDGSPPLPRLPPVDYPTVDGAVHGIPHAEVVRFVEATVALARRAVVRARIPHELIQRAESRGPLLDP